MEKIDPVLEKLFAKIGLKNQSLHPTSPIAKKFLELGINNLYGALQYVNNLHYAPPSDPFNWHLVLEQECGTCSTKHALLTELGKELALPFALGSGIYQMSAQNFPVLKDILQTSGLPYIPESHNFIVFNKYFVDLTFPQHAQILGTSAIEQMQIIDAEDLLFIKKTWYPKYLQQWLLEHNENITLDDYAALHKRIVSILGKRYNA